MERRLGRGLGSLLSEAHTTEAPEELDLARLRPNPFQPRKTFDAASLQELKASIERHGVMQPVVVRPAGEGFELIAGERRWRAARLAGKSSIPAVVRPGVTDDDMLELALVENVQRRDLDPIERARGYRQVMDRLGLTQEQVAGRVGLQRSTVTNHLRLLELPDEVQDAVGQGLISMGHARALLGLPEADRQRALLEEIVRGDLSVRVVERKVKEARETAPAATTAATTNRAPWAIELEDRLRDSLGTKVRVQPGQKERGQIVIQYFDRASLEGLITRLAPKPTL